jgi:hypothetical protein
MFHPFQYQYEAKCLHEKEGQVALSLKQGSTEQNIWFPKNLLPQEVLSGESFSLSIQPEESKKASELACLRQLLQDLIN